MSSITWFLEKKVNLRITHDPHLANEVKRLFPKFLKKIRKKTKMIPKETKPLNPKNQCKMTLLLITHRINQTTSLRIQIQDQTKGKAKNPRNQKEFRSRQFPRNLKSLQAVEDQIEMWLQNKWRLKRNRN